MRNNVNMKKVGKRINEARIAKGISISKLADIGGISSQSMANILSGTNCPSTDVLLSISSSLNVPMDYLLVDSLNNDSVAIDYMLLNVLNSYKSSEHLLKMIKAYSSFEKHRDKSNS